MSLLDDAQELASYALQTLTVTGEMVCVFCGRNPCRANCVRHSLPKIVAALEAAERFVKAETAEDRDDVKMERSAAINALVSAMKEADGG